jgi:sulfatase maturation enzyme AslB (radical SAM superfamily)
MSCQTNARLPSPALQQQRETRGKSEERMSISSGMSRTVCWLVGTVLDRFLPAFPPVVRVETTNACNARCTICPHRSLRRPIVCMDDTCYQKIIDECAAHRCRELHLHNFGEPLLDKRIEERIRYAKQRGISKVKIFSNGSLLTEDRARGLIEAGLDEIKISFDGAAREEFEQIRVPLKFDTVVANVENLVALRNRLRAPLRIYVACCSTSDKQATMLALEKLVDGFSFGKLHNWTSGERAPPRRRVRKPCARLWRTFTVLASGEVALCCLDYDGQHLLGKLDGNVTIADLWQQAVYRQVRLLHKQARQHEIPLCDQCTKAFL